MSWAPRVADAPPKPCCAACVARGEANARLALEALARRCGELQAERDAANARARGTCERWRVELLHELVGAACLGPVGGQFKASLEATLDRWAHELLAWR